MNLATLYHKLPARGRMLVLTCLCGLVGGLVAVGFHHAISWLHHLLWARWEGATLEEFVLASFLILLSVGLISGFLLAVWAPEAAGSGIPQLKLAYWRDMGAMPIRGILVKFLAGTISLGGGLSLGREGPTVQMAGGLASWAAARLGVVNFQRRTAAACGAAAGLAAAFNTPIAAVTFVLEEIIEDLNSRAIGRILLASVVALSVLYFFSENEPVFHIPAVTGFNWVAYLLAIPVGGLAALTGAAFQGATLGWRKQIRGKAPLPPWLRPLAGAMITWVAGCVAFGMTGRMGVLGSGYADLGLGLAGNLAVGTVVVLLVAKFVATTASYAWGGCGGIFAPTLFLGAMTGCLAAELLSLGIDLPPENITVLSVVGMSACLGAVVRAPVTSILIVFEMTHDFALVPPLMLGTIVSQGVSRLLCHENFYAQVLKDDGIELEKHMDVRDFAGWKSRRVAAYATYQVCAVREWDRTVLRQLLEKHAFAVFPVLRADGTLEGVVSRLALQHFVEGGANPPRVLKASTKTPDTTLGEVKTLLVEAPLNVIVLTDETGRAVVGIFTLHDLLRSQVSSAES